MRIEYRGINFSRTGFKTGDNGTFKAVVAVMGNIDAYNERIMPGAFKGVIERYEQEGRVMKVLWSHNPERPIGTAKVYEAPPGSQDIPEEIRQYGALIAEGTIATQTQDGAEAVKHMQAGTIDEWSIGFQVTKDHIGDDGIRELHEIDLFEVSPVVVGANRLTGTVSLKGSFGAFDDHADEIQDLVLDFVERSKSRVAVRKKGKKAGAVLKATNRARLQALAETLADARNEILQMLKEAEPKTEEAPKRRMTPEQAKLYFISKGIQV